MSTNITAAAEAAREQARDSSGRFGRQPAAEAVTPLNPVHGPGACSGCGLPTASGDQCRTCVTEDARDAAAAGTGPQMRFQLHGPVGEMDPQTGYLSMVAHIAEVDPGGVRERYGLDENASHDDVITAAEEDFADADDELVYADRWAQVSDDNPYAPVSEHGPVVEPGAGHLGDASVGDELVASRTYATGDPEAPYLTVTSAHGVFAQVTGGRDFATRNPLGFTEHDEEVLARDHLAEQENELRLLRRSTGLASGDDLEDLHRDIAQRERYVGELRELSPGKLSYYNASQMTFTTHTDHDDVGGSETYSHVENSEGEWYFSELDVAERHAHGEVQQAFDHLATGSFDYPGRPR